MRCGFCDAAKQTWTGKEMGRRNELILKHNIFLMRSWNQNNKCQVLLGSMRKRKGSGQYKHIWFMFLKDNVH